IEAWRSDTDDDVVRDPEVGVPRVTVMLAQHGRVAAELLPPCAIAEHYGVSQSRGIISRVDQAPQGGSSAEQLKKVAADRRGAERIRRVADNIGRGSLEDPDARDVAQRQRVTTKCLSVLRREPQLVLADEGAEHDEPLL